MSSPVDQRVGDVGTTPPSCATPSAPAEATATAGINTPLPGSPAALNRVPGGVLSGTSANTLTRKATAKRKYDTIRVAAEKAPARPLNVQSIESIVDGTCFPVRKSSAPGSARTCCGRGCNVTFASHHDSIGRVRRAVPPAGNGQQSARKIWVRECIQDDKSLALSDHAGFSCVVCQLFFVAVTGCSKKLIRSAMDNGGSGMRPRHKVNASSQVIVAFILELASRWEFQPDSQNVHMDFPSKVDVHQIFLASDACQSLAGAVSYSYFVLMWNKHCPHVRLKKAMPSGPP